MEREEAVELIHSFNGFSCKIEHNGDWINTNCPFAPYLHQSGTDSSPSFGVHYGERDFFYCFTCHQSGDLYKLIDELETWTGEDFGHLAHLIAGDGLTFVDPDEILEAEEHEGLGEPLSEDFLAVFDPAYEHDYVRRRGISSATGSTLELCFDVDDRRAERILFPVRDLAGKLYGFTGRAIKQKVRPRVRDYYGLRKKLLVLGAHLVARDHKYVLLCEGPFDYARLREYGYPALAVLHSTVSSAQSQILEAIGKPVICFFDNDRAGRLATIKTAERLADRLPVFRVRYPSLNSGRKLKDPGEIFNPKMVAYMIDTAKVL